MSAVLPVLDAYTIRELTPECETTVCWRQRYWFRWRVLELPCEGVARWVLTASCCPAVRRRLLLCDDCLASVQHAAAACACHLRPVHIDAVMPL